ncbi:hypothetical protein BJV82DRAFT_665963 [Fennellomyces sp. T-0311]|nr:hypothetical protein BJV82DRAFT_665963 [Fennellomyces sp. T-0311]
MSRSSIEYRRRSNVHQQMPSLSSSISSCSTSSSMTDARNFRREQLLPNDRYAHKKDTQRLERSRSAGCDYYYYRRGSKMTTYSDNTDWDSVRLSKCRSCPPKQEQQQQRRVSFNQQVIVITPAPTESPHLLSALFDEQMAEHPGHTKQDHCLVATPNTHAGENNSKWLWDESQLAVELADDSPDQDVAWYKRFVHHDAKLLPCLDIMRRRSSSTDKWWSRRVSTEDSPPAADAAVTPLKPSTHHAIPPTSPSSSTRRRPRFHKLSRSFKKLIKNLVQ